MVRKNPDGRTTARTDGRINARLYTKPQKEANNEFTTGGLDNKT